MMNHNPSFFKRNLRWFILSCIIVAAAVGGTVYYYSTRSQLAMHDYNEERDTRFILDFFETDRYWLTASDDYSPEYALKYHASSQDPAHWGNLTLKVLYDNNEPVGFTAYFKKKFYVGCILFVAVLNKFRSRGYGKELIDYACADLKNRGVASVELLTRTVNHAAIKLYLKTGFTETYRNDGFVYFKKDL